jgi:hypothetical protein
LTRLEILAIQIPILEAKLKAMKRERKSLKSRDDMKRKWTKSEFRGKAIAALKARDFHINLTDYNKSRRLPWPSGSVEWKSYRCLMRKGWGRQLALEKIAAGHRSRRAA